MDDETWRVSAHNGLWTEDMTTKAPEHSEFLEKMLRVVHNDGDEDYEEFAVGAADAVPLAKKLADLTAQLAAARAALERVPALVQALAEAQKTFNSIRVLAEQHAELTTACSCSQWDIVGQWCREEFDRDAAALSATEPGAADAVPLAKKLADLTAQLAAARADAAEAVRLLRLLNTSQRTRHDPDIEGFLGYYDLNVWPVLVKAHIARASLAGETTAEDACRATDRNGHRCNGTVAYQNYSRRYKCIVCGSVASEREV